MHANINATSRGISSPSFSLEYLRHILRSLSEPERTMEKFSKDSKRIRKGAGAKAEFAIDWTYGINPNNLSHEQLTDFMKHAIKYFGGVLVEFKSYSEEDGKRKPTVVRMVGTKKATRGKKASNSAEETADIERDLGHVVVAYGWGPDDENSEESFASTRMDRTVGLQDVAP